VNIDDQFCLLQALLQPLILAPQVSIFDRLWIYFRTAFLRSQSSQFASFSLATPVGNVG
jgi:hypothetical protein